MRRYDRVRTDLNMLVNSWHQSWPWLCHSAKCHWSCHLCPLTYQPTLFRNPAKCAFSHDNVIPLPPKAPSALATVPLLMERCVQIGEIHHKTLQYVTDWASCATCSCSSAKSLHSSPQILPNVASSPDHCAACSHNCATSPPNSATRSANYAPFP
jgi:hypothetical protein